MLVIPFKSFRTSFFFFNWIFFMLQIANLFEIKYRGCYFDDSQRMLDFPHHSNQMTLEMCTRACHTYRYLGLQNHHQCFCGNSFGDSNRYQKKNEDDCSQQCRGNLSQICGGTWRNSVYEFITTTVPTTDMTTPGHSTMKTTEMTTPGHSTVKTTDITTRGHSTDTISSRQNMTTTTMTTSGHSTVITTDMTTPGHSTVKTTEMTTPGHSTVQTTEMTTPEQYTVQTTEMTTPEQSTVQTTEMTTPEQYTVQTTEMTTPEVTSVQPLTCLCPCSTIRNGKWDFLRGMNLTLDQLREVMEPELDLMKKSLRVNKSNTTRMRRSKMSAPDDRVSATSVGYVGVVFICLITVLIVFIDIIGCFVANFKRRF